mmetsp:Transcript_31743/g.101250  ORF Transcript_31743/g.101250 Transcript_31743/m.101250 type:complete len:160 (-) Transcript_31743:370-849(-)
MSVLVVILPLLHALVLPHQAVRNVVTLSVRPRALSPFMGAVRKVTTAEFEQELQDCSTPILLDVFAVWCGPCQLMAPQLDQVAEVLGDRCRVLKVDADEEQEVADTLMIRGLPTVLLINDMSVVMRAEGALMADELLELVEHHFFGGPKPTSIAPAAKQ